jgi:hypothetical protein
MRKRFSGIKLDASRSLQARDGAARREGLVVGLLAYIIQIIALEQREPKSGFRVDVRFHRYLNFASAGQAHHKVSVYTARRNARKYLRTHAPKLLKNGSIVSCPLSGSSSDDQKAVQMIRNKQLDAFATNKPILFEMSDRIAVQQI